MRNNVIIADFSPGNNANKKTRDSYKLLKGNQHPRILNTVEIFNKECKIKTHERKSICQQQTYTKRKKLKTGRDQDKYQQTEQTSMVSNI